MTLWVQPSTQILTHHVVNPSFLIFSFLFGDNVKCFVQVHVDDVNLSSPAHQCHNSVLEVHQICQARSALWTNHLFIFHVPYQSFQENLLHNLSRNRGETYWPVVPQGFLFSFFKIQVIFTLFKSVVSLYLHRTATTSPIWWILA